MTTSSFLLPVSPPSTAFLRRRRFFRRSWLSSKIHHRVPQVMNDSTRTEVSIDKSEVDKLVDRIDFGELCNDFECTSSPQVESTARQLVRDILEIREGNRAFACYAVSVKYKVYVRLELVWSKWIKKEPNWSFRRQLKIDADLQPSLSRNTMSVDRQGS